MSTNEEQPYCLMQAITEVELRMPISSDPWDFVMIPGDALPAIPDAPVTVYWHGELDRAVVAAMLRAMANSIEASPQR